MNSPRLSLRQRPTGSGFSLLELVLVLAIVAALAGLLIPSGQRAADSAQLITARANLAAVRGAILGTPDTPGYMTDMRYIPGFEALPLRLHDLFVRPVNGNGVPAPRFDPVAQKGWRGPYLQNHGGVFNDSNPANTNFPAPGDRRFDGDTTFEQRRFYGVGGTAIYGTTGDPVIADPWGNPLVIQRSTDDFARLVSAGPDGVLDCNPGVDYPSPVQTDPAQADYRGDDVVVFLRRADVAP